VAKIKTVRSNSLEISMVPNEEGNAGYLRFAVIDEVDKTEQQYLTALDINNKAKLTKIRDYINNILTPNHNKKV
jgi:hypothetical protein